MNKRYTSAKKMRLAGMSYNEINRELGLSKSTLSLWFRNLRLSQRAMRRLSSRVREGSLRGLINKNKQQTQRAEERRVKINTLARREVRKLTKRDLFIAGIALYLGEGTKRGENHQVGFANSDPAVIKIMMRFLREICHVPEKKFRIAVHAYHGTDITRVEKFWSECTGIPRQQFHKTYLGVSRASKGKRGIHRLPFGTVHIRLADTALFHRIIGWIQGLTARFI